MVLKGGDESGSLQAMSGTALKKLWKKGKQGLIGHFFALTAHDNEMSHLPEMLALLKEYNDVFAEPRELPPPRPLDHHIPLKPNFEPTNQ